MGSKLQRESDLQRLRDLSSLSCHDRIGADLPVVGQSRSKLHRHKMMGSGLELYCRCPAIAECIIDRNYHTPSAPIQHLCTPNCGNEKTRPQKRSFTPVAYPIQQQCWWPYHLTSNRVRIQVSALCDRVISFNEVTLRLHITASGSSEVKSAAM
jgi:hypothetical protein